MNKKLPKLDLNITNRCNYRCVHCAFDSGMKGMKEMSLERLAKILQDTKELGGEKIDITGGEPLVRKEIYDIVKLGKQLDYNIELVTNGALLTKKKLSHLKRLGLDSIAISMDGSNYETYSRIRRVDKRTYEHVLQSIDEATSQGFDVKINTVVFQSNLADIPNITRFCIEKGVKEHGLYYFTPIGRGYRGEEKSVEPLVWLGFIRKELAGCEGATVYRDGSRMKISLEVPLIQKNKLKGQLGCLANAEQYHLQILPDGKTYPCAILASYGQPVADLSKNSVKKVWHNKVLWADYWKNISGLFHSNRGSCVDFQKAFCMKDYDMEKYEIVCPLRKFRLEEVI